MRYYVTIIQYNAEAEAENRELKAFNTRDEALAYYHKTMGNTIGNEKLAWALMYIVNSAGGVEIMDKWEKVVEPVEV